MKTFLRRSLLLLFMTQQFWFSHTNLKSRLPWIHFLAFLNFFSCGNFRSFLVFLLVFLLVSLQKLGNHCIWFILFYKHLRMMFYIWLKNCVLRGWQCRSSRCLVSLATSSLFLFSVPQASIWRSHLIFSLRSVLALFGLILLRFLKKIHKMHW